MKFKKGDKVKVKDTSNVRNYLSAEKSVGVVLTLTQKDCDNLNDGGKAHPHDNEYRCNYIASDFELVSRAEELQKVEKTKTKTKK